MLTEHILRQLWPHCSDPLITGIITAAPIVFQKYGLTSNLIIAHAMAQFSEECGAGTELEENLNYSAIGLMKTWPSRFDAATAAQFANKPQDIADKVYDGRLGNAPGSDDGWTYRGRGGSQLTGRGAYAALGAALELDLLNDPGLVASPENFLLCAVADFVALCHCLSFAANDDIEGVTYHLNGGYIGLAARKAWLVKWKRAFNLPGGLLHGALWVQQSLNQLGAEPPLALDGAFGPFTAAAVKTFQQTHGLMVDGKVGPATITAIAQALE